MPGDDLYSRWVNKTLADAKNTRAQAEKKFPGALAAKAGVKPSGARMQPPAVAAPPKAAPMPRETIREQNLKAVEPVARSVGMKGVGTIGVLHEGGDVPETGPYMLEKGEKVIPADKNTEGRNSEYRKVFVARRQSRSGGGNTPIKESSEKHDSKKATKSGQPRAKEAGGHAKE